MTKPSPRVSYDVVVDDDVEFFVGRFLYNSLREMQSSGYTRSPTSPLRNAAAVEGDDGGDVDDDSDFDVDAADDRRTIFPCRQAFLALLSVGNRCVSKLIRAIGRVRLCCVIFRRWIASKYLVVDFSLESVFVMPVSSDLLRMLSRIRYGSMPSGEIIEYSSKTTQSFGAGGSGVGAERAEANADAYPCLGYLILSNLDSCR